MYVHIPREFCKSHPQLESQLRRVVRDAAVATEAEESTIWVISPDDMFLQGAINFGDTPHVLEQIDVPIVPRSAEEDAAIIGLVLQNQHGICKNPDDRHNQLVDRAAGKKTITQVAVPINIGQHLVGVMSAINRRGGALFDGVSLDEMNWRAYLVGLVLRDYGAEDAAGVAASPVATL